jgi:hypothetical protein
MTKNNPRKRKFNHVQPHETRLTDLAQTAHASAYSPAVHPDPRSTWASSPEQGLWTDTHGLYGWAGGIGWSTP